MTKKMLLFANPEEIDSRLITTMGVNVKENDSPIGYFGTGLKFAISGVLRWGGRVSVQTGERKWEFYASEEEIRGKVFEIVYMKEAVWQQDEWVGQTPDRQLGFTTQLGRDWKPWMVYREFWANARDEKGEDTQVVGEMPPPKPGWTQVVIQCDEMMEAHRERYEWLLEGLAPLWADGELEIYSGQSVKGYYHGIAVVELERPSQFTYNLTGQQQLTEDRTISSWDFGYTVQQQLLEYCKEEEVLEAMLEPEEDSWEKRWYWTEWQRPNEAFLSLMSKLEERSGGGWSESIKTLMKKYLPRKQPEEGEQVGEVLEMLGKMAAGLEMELKSKLVLIKELGGEWTADSPGDGVIWVQMGERKEMVKGMVNGWLKWEKKWEGKEKVDWLLDRLVTLGEKVVGRAL